MKKWSKEDITKKVQRKFRRNANAQFILTILVITSIYMFFFNTETIFVKNNITIEASPLAETISYAQRTFKLVRWDYAQAENKCEIEIDVINEAYDGNDIYTYEAYSRANRVEKSLTVVPVISESTSIILQIEDIPENYAEMVLRISMPEDEDRVVRLYATKESVVQRDTLPVKTKAEYNRVRLQVESERTKAQIEEHKEEIALFTKSIQVCDEQIVELKEQLEYRSETTQEETQRQIERAMSQKEEYLRSIDTINDEILMLERDISQLENKIRGGERIE